MKHFYAIDRKAETITKNGHVEIIAFTDIRARNNFTGEHKDHQGLTHMEADVICKDLYGMAIQHAVARGLV